MVVCQSRFMQRGEVWFDNEPGNSRVDWILYLQRSSAVPGSRWKYCRTLLIDLTQEPADLLDQMTKDAVYEIRRAREKDQTTCECCDVTDTGVMDDFETMYNRFAAFKRLQPLDRGRVESMAEAGVLDLSVAKDPGGKPLTYHAHCRDRQRASELFSVSLYRELTDNAARAAITRANRYLVWSDMLRFREGGIKYFDFGGWFHGDLTPDMVNINNFKAKFGGRVVREYQCEQIRTLKGWVVLNGARLLKHVRNTKSPRPVEAK
jgi:hypothetical protein